MLSYMQLPDHGNVHLIKTSAPENLPLAFVLRLKAMVVARFLMLSETLVCDSVAS